VSVFDFKLEGLTREELVRRRNQNRQSTSQLGNADPRLILVRRARNSLTRIGQIVVWTTLAFAGLYALDWTYSVIENDPGMIRSRLVAASNVIILPDDSGSMGDKQEQLQALVSQLKPNEVNPENRTDGGGFSSTGPANNSLHKLETALRANPNADAVFVFSDFEFGDYPADVHDDAGFERLRQLLGGRRRLYLGTVKNPPPEKLIEIARGSGGGLIKVSP
jgi:hypothetical protein